MLKKTILKNKKKNKTIKKYDSIRLIKSET